MVLKNAFVFNEENRFERKDIAIPNDFIIDNDTCVTHDEVLDFSGCYAIPGLTDLHFHGCAGYDFCDGTSEAFRAIAEYEASQGITQICPATMTFPEETLIKIGQTAAAYQNESGAILCGINMEGPFISRSKKGAQNESHIHTPDAAMFRRIQSASGNLFKLLDLAVEEPEAIACIRELKDEVVLSIAHTNADYEQAQAAIDAGATHVTHLYNAMSPYTHRSPGVIGAACDNDNVHVELICDGIHVHPCVVRNTFKMFTDDRIILISDSMMATGLENGEYSLGGQAVTVTGNLATLHDGTIAGSATNLMDCVRILVKEMHVPLESAIKCAAVNPAKEIGIFDQYGSITPGKKANIVLLNEDLSLRMVLMNGKPFEQAAYK